MSDITGAVAPAVPPAPAAPVAVVGRPTLWAKVKAWATAEAHTVGVVLADDERQLLALVAPLFSKAEAAVLQDLAVFVSGVLATLEEPGGFTLADLETKVLNGLQALRSPLGGVAVSLGSSVLQALIGLALANLQAAQAGPAPPPLPPSPPA